MTIRNKLIVYAMTSILLALLAAGLSIDLIITDLYNKSAREELSDTYKNLNQQLSSIKNDMLAQTLQIAMNDSVVAITNMVDNYQDKNHYQPLIFDNDKKKTAAHLLNQIALTQSNHAAIYDKNGDLIAYATNNDQEKLAGISSFHNGKPVYIEKKNHDTKWTTTALPDDITPQVAPLDQQTGFFTYPGEVNYTTTKNQLIIENMRTITRTFPQGKIEPLGTVRVSKPLDETFFKQATNIANKNISLILHNGQLLNTQKIIPPMEDIKANALLYGDTSPISTQLLTTHTHYTLPYVWPTPSGNNYLLITLSRSNLTSALNSTRLYLTIAFSIIASITIITGIYWLNRLISRPLDALVQQAKLTDENHYPVFPINQTKDEINLLGTVLNKMVNTIKSREKDLTLRTKQLDNAQRISHIGDWELDHATDTMTWSDEQYRIFELDPATCKPSRDAIQMVIHPDDVDKTLTAFETSIKEKKPFVIIHRIMTKDMRIKFVRVYGETLYDEEGTAITSTGTMQDITEQTIKDEQLRRTQKMDALGKLTGGIAHDFNNMLGVIAGFTELLQLKFANNDQKANIYIKEIFQASERARKLTAKLLSFSRKDISSSTKTDINQLLHEEQHMLEKTLTVRIALKFNLEKDLWPVKLDRDELEDAIINMSINAMHAIPESGELVLS
ncbi:MAG: PAS domain-containing protein, partial [Gammaproteobacteria bacterium]|nr:PAS domain-containing protein [Gammaproteobacteria bacterium]